MPSCLPKLRGSRSMSVSKPAAVTTNVTTIPGTLGQTPQGRPRSKTTVVKDNTLNPVGEEQCTVHYGMPCDYSYGKKQDYWRTDSPPAYSPAVLDEIYRPEIMHTIEETIDELNPTLRKLSLDIHGHPEIMFEEKYAHDSLTAFMVLHGFEVTPHYLGLETAWRAEFRIGNGGNVLGINSEMDALPGIGHACGHNLIAISGIGVAIAVKAALIKHDIPGHIILLGTPAEESGKIAGKHILLEKGGYKDMDLCVMCHPGAGPTKSAAVGSCLALIPLEVEFFGHTAHASVAPWEGRNALDAAFLAYSNISVLRQQMRPEQRVHGIVEGRNWAPNIIPDYAKMRWIVRAPTRDELFELRNRVEACIHAAALASNCRYNISVGHPFFDVRQNSTLSEEFANILRNHYSMQTTVSEGLMGGSTDFGNVTYEIPALHPVYAIPTEPNGGNHTPSFALSASTPAAHQATLTITKALAMLGVRALNDPEFLASIRKTFHHESWQP